MTTQEYPNGTVYMTQDKTNAPGSVVTVKTPQGNQTIDCTQSQSACRAALEAALSSGEPRYQTYSSVANALRSPLVSKYPQLRQWLLNLQRR